MPAAGQRYPREMKDEQFLALIGQEPRRKGPRRFLYDVPSDPSVIVKRAKGKDHYPGISGNIVESVIWDASKVASEIRMHLAEVISISQSGEFLMMENLADVERSDDVTDDVHRFRFPGLRDWTRERKWLTLGRDQDGNLKLRFYGCPLLLGEIFSAVQWFASAQASASSAKAVSGSATYPRGSG
jgi:hypothetical protein